jgi:hypothetical protein
MKSTNTGVPISANPGMKSTGHPYFTVGAVKFSLMSVTTFGIYPLYWLYRNWQIVRHRGRSGISPFWRAFFGPLWTFSMGWHFAEEARARNIRLKLPVVASGVMYLVLNTLLALPNAYSVLSLLSFMPLLPFDFAARRLDGGGELAAPSCGRFSGWNVTWLVVGSLLLVLAVVATFILEGVVA